MSKNRRFAVRLSLLGLALVLSLVATNSPTLAASCSPHGGFRTIIVNVACCGGSGSPWVTKQNQVCSICCGWLNTGDPYCSPHSFCAT